MSDSTALTYNFTTSLHDALPQTQLVYSPLSILFALCMAALGAGGTTRTEMQLALECNPERNQFLISDLQKRKESVNITNAMFPLAGRALLPDFEEAMKTQYHAVALPQDYIQKPNESREHINEFVSKQTEGRIKDIIPEGSVNADTRNVLISTIHLQKAWMYPFNAELTQNASFATLDGANTDVQMMHLNEPTQFEYIDYGDGVEGLILPFTTRLRTGDEARDSGITRDEDFEMLFVKPTEATKYALDEAEMKALALGDGAIKKTSHFDSVKIPKFSITSTLGLNGPLKKMGIKEAFNREKADFSRMFEPNGERIYISDVQHQAKMDVNEAGIKASAATAVIMRTISIPTDVKQFVLDRPFVAVVRYKGEELFVARVTNPQWAPEGSEA